MPAQGLTGARVLLVDRDAFSASYVAAALSRAGAAVLGPHPRIGDAVLMLAGETLAVSAVVVALEDEDEATSDFLDRFQRDGIPLLLMLPRNAGGVTMFHHAPAIARPFAAFQIVDWVAGLLDRQ